MILEGQKENVQQRRKGLFIFLYRPCLEYEPLWMYSLSTLKSFEFLLVFKG